MGQVSSRPTSLAHPGLSIAHCVCPLSLFPTASICACSRAEADYLETLKSNYILWIPAMVSMAPLLSQSCKHVPPLT